MKKPYQTDESLFISFYSLECKMYEKESSSKLSDSMLRARPKHVSLLKFATFLRLTIPKTFYFNIWMVSGMQQTAKT